MGNQKCWFSLAHRCKNSLHHRVEINRNFMGPNSFAFHGQKSFSSNLSSPQVKKVKLYNHWRSRKAETSNEPDHPGRVLQTICSIPLNADTIIWAVSKFFPHFFFFLDRTVCFSLQGARWPLSEIMTGNTSQHYYPLWQHCSVAENQLQWALGSPKKLCRATDLLYLLASCRPLRTLPDWAWSDLVLMAGTPDDFSLAFLHHLGSTFSGSPVKRGMLAPCILTSPEGSRVKMESKGGDV